MTLREYISFWQETYDRHQSRPTTYAAHNYVFKNHILPGLGDIPLSELTSEMVGEFLEERKRLIESVSLLLMYMVFFVGGHDSLIFLRIIIFTVQCNNSVNVRL